MRRICIFFGLAVVLAFIVDAAITVGLKRIRTGEVGALNRALAGDVGARIVIVGSSRAYRHFNPDIIEKETGATTFNLARNGSHSDVQLAVLRAYLSRNAKPGMAIISLDMHSFVPTGQNEIFEPSLYIPHLDIPAIYNCLYHINPDVWKWKHLPLYGYVVADANLTWMNSIRGWLGMGRADGFNGFRPMNKGWTREFDRFRAKNPQGVGFPINDQLANDLESAIRQLKTDGIEPVLVYTPQYFEMLPLVTNRAEVFAKFRDIAQRTNVPFLDYSNSEISHTRDLFYNSQHLNGLGARKFSEALAPEIKKLLPRKSQDIVPAGSEGTAIADRQSSLAQ